MKKMLLKTCTLLLLLGWTGLSVQKVLADDADPVLGSLLYFDFEEEAPDFDQRGGVLFTGPLDNPLIDDKNPSAKVGMFTTSNQTWGNIRYYLDRNLDLSTGDAFSLLVYHPELTGSIRIELGNDAGGRLQIDQEYTTPGQWQLLSFTIEDPMSQTDKYHWFGLFFARDRSDVGEEWYFDDVRGPDQMPQLGAELYFDFDEIEPPAFDARGGSGFTGSVENPSKDDQNPSDLVGMFTSPNNNWGSLRATMESRFDFRTDSAFSLMVYHPELTGNVRIELGAAGSGKKQMNMEYTTPGEWQMLTFILEDAHIWHDSLDFYAFVFGTNRTDAGEEWYFDEFRAPAQMPDEPVDPGDLEFFVWSDFETEGFTNVEGFRSTMNNNTVATDIPGFGVDEGTTVALTYEVNEEVTSTGYLLWAFPTANVDGYTHLVMHVKAEEDIANAKVTLRDTNSVNGGTGRIHTYFDIGSEWEEIVIPLADFEMAEGEKVPDLKVLQLVQISFESEMTEPLSSVVYLDLVGFDVVEEPAPELGAILYFDFEEDEAELPVFINAGATYEGVVENPLTSDLNPSAHVGMSSTGNAAWDGITYRFETTLNLTEDTIFTMLVYHPELAGRTRLQFNGDLKELKLDEYYTTPGEWQLITWRIPKSYHAEFNRVMLVFAHDRSEAGETWYFDELRGSSQTPPDETPPKTYFSTENLRKDWEGYAGASYAVTDNPAPDSNHMYDKAGKFITGNETWAGIFYDLPAAVDFSKTQVFTMMVYAEHAGRVRLQLEQGSVRLELYANYNKPNEWQLLKFDGSQRSGEYTSDLYTRIVLIFDDEVNEAGKEWYFDNINGPVILDPGVQMTYFDFQSEIEPTFRGFSGGAYIGKMFNPSPDDVNAEEFVGLSYTGGDYWSGIFYDLPSTINFDEGRTFKLKIYTDDRDTTGTDSFGDFRIELRGTPHNNDTRLRMWHEYKEPGKWVEVTLKADETSIDYKDGLRNNFYHTLLIIFDDKRRDSGHEWYFHNVSGPNLTQVYHADMLFTVTNHNIAVEKYEIEINESSERLLLYNDGTNGDVADNDSIWSFRVDQLPVGTHSLAIYADDELIAEAAAIEFEVPESIWLTRVNFDHIDATNVPEASVISNKITLFPNPADAELHIRSTGTMTQIAVYDVIGKVVMQTQLSENTYTLNTSQLKSGFYMIRIADESGSVDTQRFIKK